MRLSACFPPGSCSVLRGMHLAIQGFALFAKLHTDVKFTIVGDGPERASLEGLIRHLGVERQVHLEKWMPRQELLGLMRQCEAFLFPSLRDGGGAVVVEAMAAGKAGDLHGSRWPRSARHGGMRHQDSGSFSP